MPVKSKESAGPCEVTLDIEVESTKVAAAVDRAYREFSKYISVPGFRKGMAPMAFVKQRVPQDQLRERTAELLVGPAYEAALGESEIRPYAQPRVELVKLETSPPDFIFEFKATVPLPPTVTLGKYKGLPVDRELREVTDADIDRRIDSLRDSATQYPIIDGRASQIGDVLVGNLSITPQDDAAEGDEVDQGEFRPIAITLGDPGNIPGVDDQLVGLEKGQDKDFELTYPADYPVAEYAGKRAKFIVRVDELHERVAPALDDEFAKTSGGAATMAELRSKIRAEFEKISSESAASSAESRLVDTIVETSTIDYPTVLLDVEMEEDIRTFREDLERREISVQDYLERSGRTEEQLFADFKTQADRRLRRGLVLGEIARQEKMELADEDVEQEIQRRADLQHTSVQAVRAVVDRSGGMEAVRNQAFTRKVLAFITGNAKITDKVVTGESPAAPTPAAKAVSKTATKPKPKAAKVGDAGAASVPAAAKEADKAKPAKKKPAAGGE